MKKLSIMLSVFVIASVFMSCSKESAIMAPVLVPPPSLPLLSQEERLVSPWFNPEFNIVDERNTVYLKAHHVYERSLTYDRTTHTEIAFVKLDYQRTSLTRRLPVILSCSHIISNKLCEINFAIGTAGCNVTIKNADKTSAPVITTNPFPDMQIRYIVIPKTLFERFTINWDDYAAVAQVLNI